VERIPTQKTRRQKEEIYRRFDEELRKITEEARAKREKGE